MNKSDKRYKDCVNILKEELVKAMGCTEPIALAYCAAKCREVLGVEPDKVLVEASGSIIKNVKSVIVPNTDGMKGIEVAVATGIIAGDANKKLEVISNVSDEQKNKVCEFLKTKNITIKHLIDGLIFDIVITLYKGNDTAKVRIANNHTNIVLIEKNGKKIVEKNVMDSADDGFTNRDFLSFDIIYDFAETVDINDVKELLNEQIKCNTAIAEEGLKNNYGSSIGKILYNEYGEDDVKHMAIAYATAGSDARMNGCTMPVVINSGSGNQGMTCSLPVIVYAKKMNVSEEKLYRALALSNLTTIYIKTYIGRLSAYCGAICAGSAAGAGIAYLKGGNKEAIAYTVQNALATTSGIICDGAKASCAAKIMSGINAGLLGYEMYQFDKNFKSGDGIVGDTPDDTVRNVGKLGAEGMVGTNDTIIKIMIGD